MPRNMSFAMTTEQVRAKTKTVTRRFGWDFLHPGDVVQPVEKVMGFKKGEHMKKIGGPIKIVSVRREPLNTITQEDVVREGFPGWSPAQFVRMLMHHYKVMPDAMVNRIEFEYL